MQNILNELKSLDEKELHNPPKPKIIPTTSQNASNRVDHLSV